MLTTGEGGMVATDDDLIAAVVRDFREYDEKPLTASDTITS